MADYYTLLTALGGAKLANAHVTGTPVQLTEMAIGDGLDGAAYAPSEDQTALQNEVWRAGINDIHTDADNANWLVIEGVVPEASGGWYVREVGIFDADGDLFAIGKYPETYKPMLAEGSGKDLLIRMILEISNTADVTLKIDPAIVLATRDYVDEEVADHNADPGAHGDLGFLRRAVPDVLEAGFFTKAVPLAIDEDGNVALDLEDGNAFKIAVTEPFTLELPDNAAGKAGMFMVIAVQDATGGHALATAAGYHPAGGEWSTEPDAVNLLWVTLDGSGTDFDIVIGQRGA